MRREGALGRRLAEGPEEAFVTGGAVAVRWRARSDTTRKACTLPGGTTTVSPGSWRRLPPSIVCSSSPSKRRKVASGIWLARAPPADDELNERGRVRSGRELGPFDRALDDPAPPRAPSQAEGWATRATSGSTTGERPRLVPADYQTRRRRRLPVTPLLQASILGEDDPHPA